MNIIVACNEFCGYSMAIKGFSKITIRRYRHSAKFYARLSAITDTDEINEQNVRAFFYDGRVRLHWSVNTYLAYRKSLVVFFRWCVMRGYMASNPAETIEIPKKEKSLPKGLSVANANRLLEIVSNYPYYSSFLNSRNHAIFAMFILAGLRRQELLNLMYTDVDIANFSIFIRQGKGNKDRIIPMCTTLAQILMKYIQERKKLRKTHPEFFSSLYLNSCLTSIGLQRIVTQLVQASGIKFTAHALRHTFATLMIEGGCDIYSLSKLMGHSDIKVTTIYLAASPSLLRSEIIKHPLNTQYQKH